MKVNHCGREAQKRMVRNGWTLILPKNYNETPEEIYERLIATGYNEVKVYWEGTQIRGIHSYFAFVK